MRNNQTDYREQPYIFKKTRKRIETLFSQLGDQGLIRRNHAKTIEGFKNKNIVQYYRIASGAVH